MACLHYIKGKIESSLMSENLKPNAIVEIGASKLPIGNDLQISFICGPCQLESRDHAMETAHWLKEVFERLGVNLIYKTSFDKANRSSITTQRGFGLEKSLEVFDEIRSKFGLPILTDIHNEEQCAIVAPHADILQIPAFLCRQTDLLVAAAKTNKPINVKKGQFLAPWDMKNVVNKLVASGNPNVLVTERGASFGYNTLVTDFRSLPIMAQTGAPVVFDATHSVQQPGGNGLTSGGDRTMVPYLARAAAAVGVAAIFMEAHPDPDNAPSDGPNMVRFDDLEELIASIIAHDKLTKSRIK